MNDVVIYSRPYCGYCELAKSLLEHRGIPFSEINIENEPARVSEMLDRSGGRMTFPQIFIGERHVGGFDDLAALARRGGLERMIGAGS